MWENPPISPPNIKPHVNDTDVRATCAILGGQTYLTVHEMLMMQRTATRLNTKVETERLHCRGKPTFHNVPFIQGPWNNNRVLLKLIITNEWRYETMRACAQNNLFMRLLMAVPRTDRFLITLSYPTACPRPHLTETVAIKY